MNTFDIYEGVHIPKRRESNILPDSFTGLLVGKPGSGKSTLIENLLKNKNALYKKFDLVLFLSPRSIGSLELKEDRLENCLNLSWVHNAITREKEERDVSKVLVVIDDLIAEIGGSKNNPELLSFFNNRRKWYDEETEISILITTQKFTQVPSVFRSQIQFLIFFSIPPEDFKVISTQQIYQAPAGFKSMMGTHFKMSKHNFIYINLVNYGIFLNFEKSICS